MKNTFLLLVFLLTVGVIYGQTPSTLSLQGVLREVSGAAAADGDYAMTFKIYDVLTGGTALWTETQSAVRVNNGVYSVQLGAVTALNLAFDKQYYIGVTVGGSELTPRMVLTAAPYALGFRGTQNVFGGGGNVGIGTLNPSAMLHVTGTSRFEGAATFNGNTTFAGTSSFAGNSTFPGTSTFDGRIISRSGNSWAGGIRLTSNATNASTADFYWITRGNDDTDNRRHKMVFMVPNATDQPGAGYYFGENLGWLMQLESGTGDMKVKGRVTSANLTVTGTATTGALTVNGNASVTGTITANGVPVLTSANPVITTDVGVQIASGSYVSALSSTDIYNSVPSGIKISKTSAGNYKITLPTAANFDWAKASSLQITPLNVDGANPPVMGAVQSWGGTANTVTVYMRQTTNNAFVDHDFSFFFVYKK